MRVYDLALCVVSECTYLHKAKLSIDVARKTPCVTNNSISVVNANIERFTMHADCKRNRYTLAPKTLPLPRF